MYTLITGFRRYMPSKVLSTYRKQLKMQLIKCRMKRTGSLRRGYTGDQLTGQDQIYRPPASKKQTLRTNEPIQIWLSPSDALRG